MSRNNPLFPRPPVRPPDLSTAFTSKAIALALMNWFKRLFRSNYGDESSESSSAQLTDGEKRRLLEFNEGFFVAALAARRNKMTTSGASSDILAKMTEAEISEFIELKRLNQKAVAASGQGDHSEALRYFSEACRRAPFDAISMMSMGVSYAYLGDGRNAVKCLEKALALDPRNERIRTNLRSIKDKLRA